MLYQEVAKYRMQDRMREAERARIAGEVVANRKRNGKRPQRTLGPAVLSILSLPFRH